MTIRTSPMRPPIFIIAPPASGAEVLTRSLANASGVVGVHEQEGSFFESLDQIHPARRGWQSHGLSAQDATPLAEHVREALKNGLVSDGPLPEEPRPLGAGARLPLRIQFLDAIFPDARFVLLMHDPGESTQRMLEAWRTQRAVTCPELPGWERPEKWSLPLTSNWRELKKLPLEAVVVEQYRALLETALTDLERLQPNRWAVCELQTLLEHPRDEVRRLCQALNLRYDQALLDPAETTARNRSQAPPSAPSPQLARELARLAGMESRLRDLIARPQPVPVAAKLEQQPDASPFRSVSTGSFAQILRRLNASLLISTYQAGRLVVARDTGTILNTHFRLFDKPMGIAVADGRIALGTRVEVIDFRNVPEVAPKIDPPGTHDSCYLPRNRHVTGDILVHELAYAAGELWAVATAFSCLATFDADHSFVPRWAPSFISQLTTGDRCHLNGLAIVNDRPAFVTTLGQTDEPGGWRQNKATGGCLISVDSKDVILGGLSMPHSPRWYDDQLWLLESGRGELVTVDLGTGKKETVAALPGFTRGMAIAEGVAFIGLSQIRESSTFGNLPLTKRLSERVCGVWVVSVKTGKTLAFLRFEDLVHEVFEVALLSGHRYPEIAEPDSTATMSSFQLP